MAPFAQDEESKGKGFSFYLKMEGTYYILFALFRQVMYVLLCVCMCVHWCIYAPPPTLCVCNVSRDRIDPWYLLAASLSESVNSLVQWETQGIRWRTIEDTWHWSSSTTWTQKYTQREHIYDVPSHPQWKQWLIGKVVNSPQNNISSRVVSGW